MLYKHYPYCITVHFFNPIFYLIKFWDLQNQQESVILAVDVPMNACTSNYLPCKTELSTNQDLGDSSNFTISKTSCSFSLIKYCLL